jgi:glutathione S-transferase
MLQLLGLPFEETTVDLMKGEHKRPEFLARNCFGQVPVIEDGSTTVSDSNAILVYLAGTYDASRSWWPTSPAHQAQVLRWLSVASGPLAYGPAAARAAVLFKQPADPAHPVLADALFNTMEAHLKGRQWLASDHATLAELAMYAYTAHAPEGGVSLEPYPRLRQWVARVEALPGFVGMMRTSPTA